MDSVVAVYCGMPRAVLSARACGPALCDEMGIDCAIRTWLREQVDAAAFRGSQLAMDAQSGTWVYIEDVLTVMHRMIGPRYNHTFTGSELFEAVIRPALHRLSTSSNCGAVVLCSDDFRAFPSKSKRPRPSAPGSLPRAGPLRWPG